MINVTLFSAAFRDFLRFRRAVLWFIVVLGLYGVARVYLNVNNENTPDQAYATLSAVLTFRLLPLASAIFSTAVISQEVEQKTIVYLLTRPVARWRLLAMRGLASFAAVFIIAALAAMGISMAVYQNPITPYLLKDLSALAIGSIGYGSLFILVSLLINRAMIVCLLFAFGWETSVPNLPGSIFYLSLSTYLNKIAQRPKMPENNRGILDALSGLLGTKPVTVSTSWIVLIVFSAACACLAAWWFTHFEYVPREDAE